MAGVSTSWFEKAHNKNTFYSLSWDPEVARRPPGPFKSIPPTGRSAPLDSVLVQGAAPSLDVLREEDYPISEGTTF